MRVVMEEDMALADSGGTDETCVCGEQPLGTGYMSSIARRTRGGGTDEGMEGCWMWRCKPYQTPMEPCPAVWRVNKKYRNVVVCIQNFMQHKEGHSSRACVPHTKFYFTISD